MIGIGNFKIPLISLVLLVSYLDFGATELRFCLNGPHRMLEDDCPGGFILKNSIQPTCKYFARSNGSKEHVLSAPTDLCTDDARAIEDIGDDLSDIDKFTWFMWNDDVSALASPVAEGGAFDPENKCEDECLGDWVDPLYVEDEPEMTDDWDKTKVTDEEKKERADINKKMFMKLLMDDVDDDPDAVTQNGEEDEASQLAESLLTKTQYDTTKMNIIKLLARSMRIVLSACFPFVQNDFFEQVLKGMIFMSNMYQGYIVDVGPDLYKQIMTKLDNCNLKRHLEFHLNGTRCENAEKVEGIYYTKAQTYWPYRKTGWSFRWGKWHPLLDAAWSSIDFVNSFCFESFLPNMMLAHVYEVALEGLFIKPVQDLWRTEVIVRNEKFWNNVMQTSDIETTMQNLDACTIAAREVSPFKTGLSRPFITPADLKKDPPPAATPAIGPKGWNNTIEKYWDNYNLQGGFKKASEQFGKCFQESFTTESDDMISDLKTIAAC
ncbi:hypothetical protein Ocin01_06461 [Orchesella cincta]|uniref:Uncharacterized protein n=1 Tax=Orchesella cincta TaxID=48709 RepID=A0A1D2N4L2_ORCCI|nr:hypothetical protein Ocin01_06461 [Orchesella cincta]